MYSCLKPGTLLLVVVMVCITVGQSGQVKVSSMWMMVADVDDAGTNAPIEMLLQQGQVGCITTELWEDPDRGVRYDNDNPDCDATFDPEKAVEIWVLCDRDYDNAIRLNGMGLVLKDSDTGQLWSKSWIGDTGFIKGMTKAGWYPAESNVSPPPTCQTCERVTEIWMRTANVAWAGTTGSIKMRLRQEQKEYGKALVSCETNTIMDDPYGDKLYKNDNPGCGAKFDTSKPIEMYVINSSSSNAVMLSQMFIKLEGDGEGSEKKWGGYSGEIEYMNENSGWRNAITCWYDPSLEGLEGTHC